MEVAPASTTGSETHAPADEPPIRDPPPSPHHQRRHIRYASPEASASASTHAHDDSSLRPLQYHRRSPPPATMSTPPPPITASSSNEVGASSQPQQTQPISDGQNHDRMETDDDSDDSRSDSGTDTPEPSEATTEPAPQPPAIEGEAMDTTPDSSPVPVIANVLPPVLASGQTLTPMNSTTVRIGVTANIGMNPSGIATLLDSPSLSFNMNGIDQPAGEIRVTIPNAALENPRGARHHPPPPREDSVDSRTRRERRTEQRDREDDEDRDDDSDDSSDDEENPYWASFKEDTSAPDDRELKIIEDSEKNLPTATDHEHWEKTTFEPLDDPEYIPADVGRISWTLKGVHGTPDKPNKDRIMRSPSVRIGDFYWNIKYYPRGNDGTEQVSAYVECSPFPHEEIEAKEQEKGKEKERRASNSNDGATGSGTATVERPPSDATAENDHILPDATPTETHVASLPADPDVPSQPLQTQQQDPVPETEKPWRVAAQVCCVMYNPSEPRVYATQKSCHSYYNDNPDWGWTRFHGPWDELHQRKRHQRQALLRNDTLAFTVYLRIVKDETQALWWHPPKEKPVWDSLEMTGVRAFRCVRPEQPSAIISALSAWLHLSPFLDLIRSVHIPDGFSEPDVRTRPIFEQLKNLIDEVGDYSDAQKDISLSLISTLMEVNSSDGIRRLDVIALWDHLRRLLTVEFADVGTVSEACGAEVEAFKQMLLLKQPDPFDPDSQSRKYHPEPRKTVQLAPDHEPKSVQEAVDLASQHLSKGFRVWECSPPQLQDPPKHPQVLHIELHRQHYDQTDRKWMKLGHRIALDEELTFSNVSYSLYGLIVHSGSLESQEYYTVIRPAGPQTRWIKYAGENSSRKVAVLTSKQAVTAHEGSGDPVLEKRKSDKKKENAAVAYIAMYVRSDLLPGVLATPFDRKLLDAQKQEARSDAPATSEPAAASDAPAPSERTPAQIPVYLYSGDAFSGMNDLETFDPWSQKLREESKDVCCILLPETTVVRDVKAMLELLLSQIGDQKPNSSVKLWLLDTRKPALGALPAFYGFNRHEEDALETVPLFSEGCRFWIGGQDSDVIRSLIQHLRNSNPAQLLEDLRKRAKVPVEQNSSGEEQRNEVEIAAPGSADVDDGNREEGEVAESGDTVMSDAQDTANEPPVPPVPAAVEPQALTENANDIIERQVLCFVKLFDWENQTMQSVKSFSAPVTANVLAEIKKALELDQKPQTATSTEDAMDQSEEPKQPEQAEEAHWDVYHERFQFAKTHDLVTPTATFENHTLSTEFLPGDVHIIVPTDGACFIAQRRPSPDQYYSLPRFKQYQLTCPAELSPLKPPASPPLFLNSSATSLHKLTILPSPSPIEQHPTSAPTTSPAPNPTPALMGQALLSL